MEHRDEFAVLNTSLKVLRLQQLWPQKGQSFTRGYSYYFRLFIALLLCVPTWLLLLLHLIVTLKDNTDVEIIEDLGLLIALFGMHVILISFVYNQKKLATLYKNLSNFQDFGKPDNFDKQNRICNQLSVLYTCYCMCGVLSYLVLGFIEEPACEKLNLEKNLNEICGLPAKIWVPFDVNRYFMKQIILVNQLYALTKLPNSAAIIIFTIFEISEYLVLKIEHLNDLLRKVFDDCDEQVSRKRLINCIKYHSHIIQLFETYNTCYKYCNGCFVVMAGIIFALLANQFVTQASMAALIHLGGWMVAVFIACYAGQTIFSGSLTIAPAAFESKWYEGPIELQKDLMVLMTRAQQPFCLTAAPVGVMSMSLFVNLVRSSYSYFAVLDQTT